MFKKLNFKQHNEILILNSPTEFEPELKAMQDCATIKIDIKRINDIEFVLTFIKTQAEIDNSVPLIDKKLKGDGIVWFAYPKWTSKKYKAEVNRTRVGTYLENRALKV